MKYRICLKSVDTGEIRVRNLKWNQSQYEYYSHYIGKSIEGFKILWIEPIKE